MVKNIINRRPLFLGIIFVLLALVVLLATLYLREKITTVAIQKDRNLILKNLGEIRTRYDKVLINSEKVRKDLEIAVKESEAKTLSLQAAEKKILKVDSIKKQMEFLEKERERLTNLTGYLLNSNKLLDRERDSIKNLYEKEKIVIDSVMPVYKELAKFMGDKEETVSTVKNVYVNGYNAKGKVTSLSKKISKLKVCYTVLKTRRLKEGRMRFFIQVIDPNGSILGDQDSVSNTATGVRVTYTTISQFDYVSGGGIDVCTFVEKLPRLIRGNYTINVFDHNLNSIDKTMVFME